MTTIDTIRQNLIYIRAVMALLSWTGIILRFVVAAQEPDQTLLEPIKYFTIQTNLLVALWLTFSVIYRDFREDINEERMQQLYGLLRGGITAFITLTWLAYWALLSSSLNQTGIGLLSSNINHYVVPIYFIIDWLITERSAYQLNYIAYWMIYPLAYIILAYIYQLITEDPIYDFFDLEMHGLGGFVTEAITLLIAFLIFCFVYFGLNKLIVKSE